MEKWIIGEHTLEYIDEIHQYICNGLLIPSITEILKIKFGKKYDGIDESVLENARNNGVYVHKVIEDFEKFNIDVVGCQELVNYKFLKKQYKFKCLDNEIPVILFKDEIPIAGGRLDLLLEINEVVGLGDIKRTSKIDKEYLGYQLNLYRIAYMQCYGLEIEFLKGLHLRNDVRKLYDIPINEDMSWKLVEEYLERESEKV